MVLSEVLYQIKVQLVINWSSRVETLEFLTKVDVLRIFKMTTFFEIFEIH